MRGMDKQHRLLGHILEGREHEAVELIRRSGNGESHSMINFVDEFGQSLLHWAIDRGLPNVALELLARADFVVVNQATDFSGATALHWAADVGMLEVCRVLLQVRSDFAEADKQITAAGGWRGWEGERAIDIARRRGFTDVLTLLLDESYPSTQNAETGVLWSHITGGEGAKALRLLGRYGVGLIPDINMVDGNGQTLLHHAIDKGLQEVALVLLGRSDFNVVNQATAFSGATALHWAADVGMLEVCRVLLQERPDFTEAQTKITAAGGWRGWKDEAAIDVAMRRGHADVVFFLESTSH
eukprot:TRINITY_DN91382_c0_g1_i1.p1 TRINITY_DN91382_c0_g1~~TRINITY_DN91382_c0_g1_i1.p1  ORF type:complete len:299 (+),score=54.31 TRINITY_DN91382_c0_g1_i1:41-937(+)